MGKRTLFPLIDKKRLSPELCNLLTDKVLLSQYSTLQKYSKTQGVDVDFKQLKKVCYAIEKNFIATIIEYCNEKYRKNKYYNFKILSDIKNKNFSKFSNIILTDKNNIFNKNISNIIKFNRKNANSHNLIKTFLINESIAQKNENIFFNARQHMLENKSYYRLNLKQYFTKFANIKFLGSGINYLVARKFSNLYTKKFNKTIAFDVIENHKHIDISSESLLFIFCFKHL